MPRFALAARHTRPEDAGVLSARKLLHLHHEQPDTLWTIEVKSGVWQTITAYRIIICQLTWTATRTNRSTYLFLQGASHPSYPEMQGPPGSASKRRVAADALALPTVLTLHIHVDPSVSRAHCGLSELTPRRSPAARGRDSDPLLMRQSSAMYMLRIDKSVKNDYSADRQEYTAYTTPSFTALCSCRSCRDRCDLSESKIMMGCGFTRTRSRQDCAEVHDGPPFVPT